MEKLAETDTDTTKIQTECLLHGTILLFYSSLSMVSLLVYFTANTRDRWQEARKRLSCYVRHPKGIMVTTTKCVMYLVIIYRGIQQLQNVVDCPDNKRIIPTQRGFLTSRNELIIIRCCRIKKRSAALCSSCCCFLVGNGTNFLSVPVLFRPLMYK